MRTETLAIFLDTFREASARKLFWGLFGISTLLVAFFLFILQIDIVQGGLLAVSVLGATSNARPADPEQVIRVIYAGIGGFMTTFSVLMAIFASSGLVVSMLDQGRIELLLSKPVGRIHLLIGRYLANVLVVALNAFYVVGGVWIILGIKTHIWGPQFLWSAVFSVLIFAVFLAVIVLVGVLTESGVLAVMVCIALLIATLILGNLDLAQRLLSSEAARNTWEVLYWILPKSNDLVKIPYHLITNEPINPWPAISTSLAFGLATLGLASYLFQKKDF